MKQTFLSGILALALFPAVVHATSAYYTNNGVVTTPPVVDATNFVNNGTFTVVIPTINQSYFGSASLPYGTSNTRNFTNNGSMLGGPGFRFDLSPSSSPGVHKMASSFFNGPLLANGFGTVEAQGIPCYLTVSATNIVNKGNLNIGAGGLLSLTGTNINLLRSAVQVKPILGNGSSGTSSNFTPDVGIYDNYWAQSNMTFTSGDIYDDFTAFSPQHNVLPGPVSTFISAFAPDPDGFGYWNMFDLNAPIRGFNLTVTNQGLAGPPDVATYFIVTNWIFQSAFIGTNADGNMSADVRFAPSGNATNDFQSVSVELAEMTTNAATGGTNVSAIYFTDTLASQSGRGLRVNLSNGTFRPANYSVSRIMPPEFAGGSPENIDPNPFDLYDPSGFIDILGFFFAPNTIGSPYASNEVSGAYSAYSATVDNLTSRPVVGDAVTNLPGRISIVADVLDLTKTRMRAEGLLTVQTRHLVGSANATIDSENLNYTLGSTNGFLLIKDLVKPTVARTRGDLFAWSALWNNSQTLEIPNYKTNSTTGDWDVYAPITNIVLKVRTHVLILDATTLQFLNPVPVIVYNMVIHSTNIVVADTMTVFKSLLFDGLRLTLNGNLTFSTNQSLQQWSAVIAPKVLFFTNTAYLNIPSDAHFGDDRPPYDSFVINSNGYIQSVGQFIFSTNIVFDGTIGPNVGTHALGSLHMSSRSNYFTHSYTDAGGDMQIDADAMYLTNSAINILDYFYYFTGSGRVTLNVANSLVVGAVTNGSYTSDSLLYCGNGFSLPVKPAYSDMLGLSIISIVPDFAEVDHVWSGDDVGPIKAGFTNNNAAIGKLTLVNPQTDSFFQPLIYFAASDGGNHALYVDDLDLRQLADSTLANITNMLGFDPNMVIYYAYSEGVAAEDLNHACNDHLRWVTNFTGPYSTTNFFLTGDPVAQLVNRARRESLYLDDDGDSILNGNDPNPFDPPADLTTILKIKIKPTPPGPGKQGLNNQSDGPFDISWPAAAKGIYQVQYSTKIPPNWQPLLTYTNNATAQTITITDKPPVGTSRRFYRVGFIGYSP